MDVKFTTDHIFQTFMKYTVFKDKKIAYEIKDENELAENLIKDFDSVNNINKKNIDELNDYGERILKLTTAEVLKLRK